MALPKLLIAATTDAEMRYASSISVPDPFILLDTGRKRYVLVSSLEYGRVKKVLGHKKKFEVVLFEKYYEAVKKDLEKNAKRTIRKRVKRVSVLARIAVLHLKRLRIRKVLVPRNVWALHVEQLRKKGILAEVSSVPLYPERAVKNKAEVAEILKVRDACVEAMKRCFIIIKQSKVDLRGELVFEGKKVTSESLRIEARKVLLEHDCEASELIISHGKQTAYPHETGNGPLKVGEPVILDFFPRSTELGYWFDMTRTVCKGTPSKELQKLWTTVKEAQDTALRLIRPGIRTGKIHAAVEEVFTKHGYQTTATGGYLHSTGHGVGLEIHEAPSLGKGGRETLKKGNVITIEPGLYYPRLGGVRLENTVLVTATGYKDLTRMGRVLPL